MDEVRNCSPGGILHPVLLDGPGPLDLRWYALAYIFGLLLAWWYVLKLTRDSSLWVARGAAAPKDPAFTRDDIDELLFLATIGVIVGGRLGYVLFYMHETDPQWWLNDAGEFNVLQALLRAINVTAGGMSFHGGLLGVGVAIWWLSYSRNKPAIRIADAAAAATPIGLLLGRMANFINGELYGRPWEGPWAVQFPCAPDGGAVGRHPSQLYEAFLEGTVLFAILYVLIRRFHALARPGLCTGIFLAGYAAFRSFVEIFREPDKVSGSTDFIFMPFGLTMGQFLSIPMFLGGVALIVWALRQPPADGSRPSTKPAPKAAQAG